MSSPSVTNPKNEQEWQAALPGEVLKTEREKKGLTTKNIAQSLNLPERFIIYLEAGDYHLLPGHTFSRGYIRNYAKLLGLNIGEDLVIVFDGYTGTDASGSSVSNLTQIKHLKRFSNGMSWLIRLVALLVVIGAIVLLWQNYMTSDGYKGASSLKTNSIVAEPTNKLLDSTSNITQLPLSVNDHSNTVLQELSVAVDDNESTSSTKSQEVQVVSQSAETTSTQIMSSQPMSAQTTTSIAAVTLPETSVTPEGQGRVQIKVAANCWTSLTDGNGKILFSKLITKDQSVDIQGKPPFDLVLGAPDAATVTYNGEPVTIKATSGSTFRIKLGKK